MPARGHTIASDDDSIERLCALDVLIKVIVIVRIGVIVTVSAAVRMRMAVRHVRDQAVGRSYPDAFWTGCDTFRDSLVHAGCTDW